LRQIITFINEKGGVGKSSVCFNTAWELANQGKNILIIDLDGQKANISFFTGVEKDNISTIADVFKHDKDINSCIINVKRNLDIIPANSSVASLDMSAKVSKLRKAIAEIHNDYDFIFIDVNPTPSWSHYLSLSVSDFALIIMLPDVASLEANKGILDAIDEIQQTTNHTLKILGFLFNKFDRRTILSRQVFDIANKMASNVNSRVFNSRIRQSVLLSENVLKHKGITDYRLRSSPKIDYLHFIQEFKEVIINNA